MPNWPGANHRKMRTPFATMWPAKWVASLAIAACLAWAGPANGKLYSYTQIADNSVSYMDYFSLRPGIIPGSPC